MKIESLKASKLRNEEYFQYHSESYQLALENHLSEGDPDQTLLNAYAQLIGQVDAALEAARKSALTPQIDAADENRDNMFRGFKYAIDCDLLHFDAVKQAAARRIQVILDRYGDIANLSRDQESASLYNLIQDLRTPAATADITLLGLTGWLTQMDNANNQYKILVAQRYAEEPSEKRNSVSTLRPLLDATYDTWINYVNAFLVITPAEPNHLNYATALNKRVAHYNTLIAQREAARAPKQPEAGTPAAGVA